MSLVIVQFFRIFGLSLAGFAIRLNKLALMLLMTGNERRILLSALRATLQSNQTLILRFSFDVLSLFSVKREDYLLTDEYLDAVKSKLDALLGK